MNLQSYTNEKFGDIRVTIIKGDPWFVAADVCKVLGLSNTTVFLANLAVDEKAKLNLGLRGGGVNTVNEAGLYKLILRSRKKEAVKFQDWITRDILPTIRKTGGYVADEAVFLETYFPALDEQAKQFFAMTLQQVRSLGEKIKKDEPKVKLADAVTASSNSILIGELAKILKQNGFDTGRDRLFEVLRNEGYLIKDNNRADYNLPTQKSMNASLMEIKESFFKKYDGGIITRRTPMITGKGQKYFTNRYLKAVSRLS